MVVWAWTVVPLLALHWWWWLRERSLLRFQLVLDTSEMAGTITAELSPGNPGGTDAVVEIEIRSKGLLSSMFFPAIKNAIGSGFPQQVSDMGVRLSSSPE